MRNRYQSVTRREWEKYTDIGKCNSGLVIEEYAEIKQERQDEHRF